MPSDPDKVYSAANLQAMNDDFLAARLAEVLPDGAPAPPDAATQALDAQLTATRTAMMTSSDPSLQAQLEQLLQQRWPQGAVEPETAPSPTTINFQDGTPDEVKATFCMLAQEEGASIPEAQAIVDSLRGARAMAPQEARAELARAWGPQLEANCKLADQAFPHLPLVLQAEVNALDDFGSRPSPAVIKALVAWAHRPARRAWH